MGLSSQIFEAEAFGDWFHDPVKRCASECSSSSQKMYMVNQQSLIYWHAKLAITQFLAWLDTARRIDLAYPVSSKDSFPEYSNLLLRTLQQKHVNFVYMLGVCTRKTNCGGKLMLLNKNSVASDLFNYIRYKQICLRIHAKPKRVTVSWSTVYYTLEPL